MFIPKLSKEKKVIALYQGNVIIKKGSLLEQSQIFINVYTLPTEVGYDAKKSISMDNAGGNSEISEMYSIEYFQQIGATNFIFEKEVEYWIDYKMVDYICTIDGTRVGISVARGMGYPTPNKFTSHMAHNLLYKKIYGLIVARNAVTKKQSFYKSILHIWCQDERIANLLQDAYNKLLNDDCLEVKGVLILHLTICDDDQIYKNYHKLS